MIVDILQLKSYVQVSYVNEQGFIDIENIPLPQEGYTNWVITGEDDPDADPVIRNYDGQRVKKVPGSQFKDLNLHEFLFYRTTPEIRDKIFAYNKPQFFSVDIETEITDSKPDPDKAETQILSIAITAPNMATVVMSTSDVNIENVQRYVNEALGDYIKKESFPVKHFKFDTEQEMLTYVFKKFCDSLHCHGGWFYDGYDFKYFKNRAKKLNIDFSMISPIKRLHSADSKPYHRIVIDYMDAYKLASKGLYLSSFSLNYIAEYELGLTKLDSGMSLKKLFSTDYDKFIAYNAIDTILVQMIHRKTNKFDKALNMAYYVSIPVMKAYGQIAIIDSLIFKKLYSKGLVYANEREKTSSKESYAAAYVKEPIKNEVNMPVGIDAKSLYPSTMMSFPLSPDTYVGKCKQSEVQELKAKGYFVSHRLSVYKNPEKPSLYKEIEQDLSKERAQYKDAKGEIWEQLMTLLEQEGEKRGMHLKSRSEYS